MRTCLKESGRWPGFESFLAARFAAYLAYRMAGIHDPLEELDLVELHDAFTISDIQTYGDIGLRPYGQEPDYIESGDAYFEGKCPSNLSGGLLGTMHAVGATGVWQACEVFWQIQDRYDYIHWRQEMVGPGGQGKTGRLEEPSGHRSQAGPVDQATPGSALM